MCTIVCNTAHTRVKYFIMLKDIWLTVQKKGLYSARCVQGMRYATITTPQTPYIFTRVKMLKDERMTVSKSEKQVRKGMRVCNNNNMHHKQQFALEVTTCALYRLSWNIEGGH